MSTRSNHLGRSGSSPARTGRVGGPAAETRLARVGLPVLGAITATATWQFVTWFFEIRKLFLPSPLDIVGALREYHAHLMKEAWVTIYETLAGFVTGAVCGLAMALLLTALPLVERAVMPLVIALNAIPKVALVPLFTLWYAPLGWGLGPAPRITLAASICFFPIMIATMAGLNSTPADLAELSRSLSASRWQSFVKVRMPWALPQVFVGLKLGMTLAVIGAVVAQLYRPSAGLGAVIARSGSQSDTSLAFAAIALLMLISIALFYLVVAAERTLLPWARATFARA